jgi:thioesterase domain-containing protein
VAFEMARQLAAAGETVELLALIDVPVPGQGEAAEALDSIDLLLWFATDLAGLVGRGLTFSREELLPLLPEERVERLLRDALQAGVLPADFGVDELSRHLLVFSANARALADYRPGAYPGSVLLLLAEGREAETADPAALWGALAGRLTTERIPGNHYTLVRRPHVERLAERLAARLEARKA